jgi:radical SAM superfamily enzyme YgiQ (UPF0313 family)
MRYEEPVFRPPCESESLIIQATIGCPHNKCTFCGMYKMKKYRVRPLEEIREDLAMAQRVWRRPDSIFLADGNTIAMRTEDLVRVLDSVKEFFGDVARISCYGGARFIKGRKVADLERLKRHGLDIVYMGLESGDDEILRMVNKGATADDYVRSAQKMKAAGLELSTYVLAGLGGSARSTEHALGSAATLNRMQPDYVRIRTLALMPGFPMYEDLAAGEFVECCGAEVARETRLLLENLELEDARFLSDHVSNYLPIYGRLPQDKESMLEAIDEALAQPDNPMLRPRTIRSL